MAGRRQQRPEQGSSRNPSRIGAAHQCIAPGGGNRGRPHAAAQGHRQLNRRPVEPGSDADQQLPLHVAREAGRAKQPQIPQQGCQGGQ